MSDETEFGSVEAIRESPRDRAPLAKRAASAQNR